MTREEAIEIMDKMPLCNECDSSNFPYTCCECGDAFLLAVEALKQPEIVRCKDCKHSEHWYGDKRRCFLWHETGVDVFNDGFCNYGERADGVKLDG